MGNSKSNRVTDVRLRALFFAFAFAFAAFALGGCTAAQNETQASGQQMANRQYMAQVNQKMESLTERLSGFSDAVSRGDVVTMRTQADNAFKVIEGLSGIDVRGYAYTDMFHSRFRFLFRTVPVRGQLAGYN